MQIYHKIPIYMIYKPNFNFLFNNQNKYYQLIIKYLRYLGLNLMNEDNIIQINKFEGNMNF